MRAALGLILLALLASGICGHIVTKQQVNAVVDDAAPEARLYFGLIKNKTKNVYSAIKTKLGFNDDDDEEDDDMPNQLGLPRIDEEDCPDQAQAAIWPCLVDPGVVHDDSLMTCMVGYISDDCRDEFCEVVATYTFLSCP